MSKSSSLVFLSEDKTTPLTSTYLIAQKLGRETKEINRLITKHKDRIEKYGHIEFLKHRVKLSNGGYNEIKNYYLNEQQACFVVTLMRNCEKVLDFKQALVDAFFQMKEKLNKPAEGTLTVTEEQYIELRKEIQQEVYQSAYDEGWNDRNSTASLNWQEFNDLITVCQYNLDLKTQCLELMRDTKNIMNKLTEIKDNMNMLATGYIGTQSRVLDKLKSVKTAWLQRTQK